MPSDRSPTLDSRQDLDLILCVHDTLALRCYGHYQRSPTRPTIVGIDGSPHGRAGPPQHLRSLP